MSQSADERDDRTRAAPARDPFPAVDDFLASHRGTLIVQPRMGFSDIGAMLEGLRRVKALPFPTLGTITLDSFTRTGRLAQAEQAVQQGQPLNGFPVLAYPRARVREMLASVQSLDFPVQVRHGTPLPLALFRGLREIGIGASEGGPVSYCLPYGQVPLTDSLENWAESCRIFAEAGEGGPVPHLETFGGCMMGQLGAPSLLVAVCLLEAMFFERHGLRSVSLSYAQGTSKDQDAGALAALRRLADRYLRHRWHVVLYTYMGLFPRTLQGARRVIVASAQLAAQMGCERLIVKTASEASRIPSVDENLDALGWAMEGALGTIALDAGCVREHEEAIYEEAAAIVDRVLDLHPDLDTAIREGFRRGMLDVPYCMHPDNRGLARTVLDRDGVVRWADTGALPIRRRMSFHGASGTLTSGWLLDSLAFYRKTLDQVHETRPSEPPRAQPRSGHVVLTTIPSDSHSWNLIFIELLLREDGYDVTNLGMCVSIEHTLEACHQRRPDFLVVSTINGHGYLEGPDIARAIRGDPRLEQPRLVFGGLIHSDPALVEHHAAQLRDAGFDHVYVGEDGVAAFRELLSSYREAADMPSAERVATAPCEDEKDYRVVVDAAGRYAIRPVQRPLPEGFIEADGHAVDDAYDELDGADPSDARPLRRILVMGKDKD